MHLCEPARAILRELASRPRLGAKGGKASDLEFTTTGTTSFSGFSRLKARLDKDSGVSEPAWVFHDFRRTFSTRIVDPEFGVSESDADRVLNHVRTGVKRHYQMNERKAQREQALRLWGDHVVKCASAQAVWVAARAATNKAEPLQKARDGAARSIAKRAARKTA